MKVKPHTYASRMYCYCGENKGNQEGNYCTCRIYDEMKISTVETHVTKIEQPDVMQTPVSVMNNIEKTDIKGQGHLQLSLVLVKVNRRSQQLQFVLLLSSRNKRGYGYSSQNVS